MINKKTIDKLLEMPDDKLNTMLKILMSGAGMETSGKKMDEKTIRKIRAVLKEITEEDLERADILMKRYQEG